MIKLVGTVLAVAALGAGSSAEASQQSRPRFHPDCIRRSDRVQVIHFRAADRIALAGALFGARGPVVVLAHQVDGTLCGWVGFARRLKKFGYRAFAFDFRGYGASSRRRGRLRYDADVRAAVAALRSRGVRRIVLLGASMGGTAVLTAAAQLRPALPAAALSAPAEFAGMNAEAGVAAADFPILLLASRGDRDFAADQQRLYDAARTSDKYVELVDGYDHGIRLLTGQSRLRVLNRVFGFLARQTRR
jgi:alpha-beta hydrolase superfamily lysophospholipase